MGQFIQDGNRILFETVMNVEKSSAELVLGEEAVDLDGLNYLAGKTVDFVNKSAMNGTILAHTDGQVPNLRVDIPEQNEFYLGQLFYFCLLYTSQPDRCASGINSSRLRLWSLLFFRTFPAGNSGKRI